MSKPSPGKVKAIFNDAVDLPAGEQAAFLEAACGQDAELRRRVERLLESFERAGDFLSSPTRTSPTGGPTPHGEALPPGTMLGKRYRITALTARGGMGEVYRADDLELRQTVALKLLPEELARDEPRLARLRDEVRVARQVSHPNVCRVYDIEEAGDRRFLAMEWIEGRDLASILESDGRPPVDRAASIARQICAGLAAAHDRGVVHRDLKPANVMLDDRGVARITDFGLAEAAAVVRGERAREGTPKYMSPEQFAGGDVGPASDLYSLGLVLYELFTGRQVFSGDTLEELTQQRLRSPTPPSRRAPEIDRGVEKLILRCLAEDPSDRPASAREIIDALPQGESIDRALSFAQQRADRIAAFRAEVAELRRAGLLRLDAAEIRAVDEHHERVLRDLVRSFDVDVSERGKQLSLGMRAVSFVGAFALAASVYYFFYRIWGTLSTPSQVGLLAGAPIATLLLTAAIARRDRQGYFTLISALVAVSCVIVDVSMLGSIFNLVSSPLMLLAWGLFALILAYRYRLRLLLATGIVFLNAFLAATFLHWAGGDWPQFPTRPEGFLPGGLVLVALAMGTHRRRDAAFGSVYCALGIFFLVAPSVLLGMFGWMSYLAISERTIEIAYQVAGFATSAAAVWLGIAWRWKEAVYTGTLFFVCLLFIEFVNWWWAWMPRYLFFLIVALTSVGVMIVLQRLRRAITAAPREAAS